MFGCWRDVHQITVHNLLFEHVMTIFQYFPPQDFNWNWASPHRVATPVLIGSFQDGRARAMNAAMIDDEYNVDNVHLRRPKKPKGSEALKAGEREKGSFSCSSDILGIPKFLKSVLKDASGSTTLKSYIIIFILCFQHLHFYQFFALQTSDLFFQEKKLARIRSDIEAETHPLSKSFLQFIASREVQGMVQEKRQEGEAWLRTLGLLKLGPGRRDDALWRKETVDWGGEEHGIEIWIELWYIILLACDQYHDISWFVLRIVHWWLWFWKVMYDV